MIFFFESYFLKQLMWYTAGEWRSGCLCGGEPKPLSCNHKSPSRVRVWFWDDHKLLGKNGNSWPIPLPVSCNIPIFNLYFSFFRYFICTWLKNSEFATLEKVHLLWKVRRLKYWKLSAQSFWICRPTKLLHISPWVVGVLITNTLLFQSKTSRNYITLWRT